MRIKSFWLTIIMLLLAVNAEARREHSVFFEGTDHELNVYRVFGKKPGKTILLIGGIQGDEPGGFMSADLYADMALRKGNLIVVPRANFHSIVLNRRHVNEDMNRKFADDTVQNYETKVVSILKELIAESDCLLNLHDGSGFYSDTWVSDQKNPNRYGQSIIADCETYTSSDKKTVIELGKMARQVIEMVNSNISEPEYHFHFNNHRTSSSDSMHKVQRKSATYYALVKCGIPAFGIESSKSLPLELKVRHHIYAINAFMETFDVIPELPPVNLEKPELYYLVLSVNDSLPIVVKSGQTLFVNPGDTVTVMHIEANFERGLSADVVGTGSINDIRKPLVIEKPTRVTVRKDYDPCGSIYISLEGEVGSGTVSVVKSRTKKNSFLMYRVTVNGVERIVGNYETVALVSGDLFRIEDVITDSLDPSELLVNFKGYVGDTSTNTGEDRGYTINTATDLWPSYSIGKDGRKYQVVTKGRDDIIGKLYLELVPPKLDYLLIKTGGGVTQCYRNGEAFQYKTDASGENQIHLIDIISNVTEPSDIDVCLSGSGSEKVFLKRDKPLRIQCDEEAGGEPCHDRIDVLRKGLVMGSVTLNYLQETERDE